VALDCTVTATPSSRLYALASFFAAFPLPTVRSAWSTKCTARHSVLPQHWVKAAARYTPRLWKYR